MSDESETPTHVAVTDPRFREAVAATTDPVLVIHLGNKVDIRDAAKELELGDDHRAWLAFIDEAVGGSAETVIKSYRGGYSFYLNSEDYHQAERDRFNPVATMLLASADGVQLQHATPMFGTVVVTGFHPKTLLPRPLDGAQMLANLDMLVANERLAQAVIESLDGASATDQ